MEYIGIKPVKLKGRPCDHELGELVFDEWTSGQKVIKAAFEIRRCKKCGYMLLNLHDTGEWVTCIAKIEDDTPT